MGLFLKLAVVLIAIDVTFAVAPLPLFNANKIVFGEKYLFGNCFDTCSTGTVSKETHFVKGAYGCSVVKHCKLLSKGTVEWFGRCDQCICDCYRFNKTKYTQWRDLIGAGRK